MTPSDNLILDPAYWLTNPEKEHLLRLWIFEAMSTKPLDPPKYDLDSVTELESELDVPLKPQTLPQVIEPFVCDPDSVMESESKLDVPPKPETLLQVIEPFVCDPDSVTESESELDVPLKHTPIKPVIKPLICDPDSITESESELDVPPETSNTPTGHAKEVILHNTKSATPRLYILEYWSSASIDLHAKIHTVLVVRLALPRAFLSG
ncbi:hypothetical protein EDB19DRAFT_1834990 [Suillus lakei]|nr:hypothetical protein EDB19DRAFT_1834990 [Suillus lakei]